MGYVPSKTCLEIDFTNIRVIEMGPELECVLCAFAITALKRGLLT